MDNWLIQKVREAGAPSEDTYERNGFLSEHAETHALVMGVAAGWFAAVTGDLRLLGLLYAAAVTGLARGRDKKQRRTKVLRDVAQEPHYATAGMIVGWPLGAVTLAVTRTFLCEATQRLASHDEAHLKGRVEKDPRASGWGSRSTRLVCCQVLLDAAP